MNLNQLNIQNFRNYESCSVTFQSSSIHCLCGKNAQGKTNLIESIYFLSHLHSFRTGQLSSLVKQDKDYMQIEAKVESNQTIQDLKIIVTDKKKHLFRFQNPVNKYSDFVGIVNAILFCPDDMILFQKSPRNRRHFIDMELIKLSKTYTYTLSHYQNLLKERNQILKMDKVDDVLLKTYTDQMIKDQLVIIGQRSQFIKELMEKSQNLYPFFEKKKKKIGAVYKTFVDINEDMEGQLQDIYDKNQSKDKYYKQTMAGIHKDDIVFLLNDKPVYEIASQGQKRSFLLALKLGLADIIKDKSYQYPILLLDDVFSELDNERKRSLIQNLPDSMQIFITTTEPVKKEWFMNRSYHLYMVENGMIREAF